MSIKASFAIKGRNPDVLTCIANLSNDEVFTPPELANRMLDDLAAAWSASNGGKSIWADKTVRFLDPCAKSGVFLREITKRLIDGLKDEIPDLQERTDHILSTQVFGIAITKLTALLSRRSLYCSKKADGKHSIASGFGSSEGNIWYNSTQHTWKNDKCAYCGASQIVLDRDEGQETHAYAFIHNKNSRELTKTIFPTIMQFDVVIGNPPYQLEDGGFGTSAAPIYQIFVEKALELDPKFAVFITPSRWMAGGKGLDKFRAKMLSDRRLKAIVDYPKLYEAFPGVKIRGGVSYFIWDKAYNGPCGVQTIWEGKPTGPVVERFLDQFDVLVRRNEAIPILHKVKSKNEPTLDKKVSSGKPFGLRTFFHGLNTPSGISNPVTLYGSQRITFVHESEIPVNSELIDKYKVLMTAVQGTSAAVETKFLSKPIVTGLRTACTETYVIAGVFSDEEIAKRYAAYLSTRFVRFLVSLRKATQHATRDVYAFVPDLVMDRIWSDGDLYARYGLTHDEIAFIESQVAPHDSDETGGTDVTDSQDE